MVTGCDKLGMIVGVPVWIEVENTRDSKDFERLLDKTLKEKFKTS